MKKAIMFVLLAVFTFGGATAVLADDAHYEEIKKYKAAKRMAKEEARKNPAAAGTKEKGFWEKEGERSGLGDSGNRFGNAVKGMNPVPFFKNQREKYEARKTGGVK
jgi:hypothetical protein